MFNCVLKILQKVLEMFYTQFTLNCHGNSKRHIAAFPLTDESGETRAASWSHGISSKPALTHSRLTALLQPCRNPLTSQEPGMHVPQPESMLFPEDSIFQIALQISLDKLETVARSFCTTAQDSFCLEEVYRSSEHLSLQPHGKAQPASSCLSVLVLDSYPHLPSCILRCFFLFE